VPRVYTPIDSLKFYPPDSTCRYGGSPGVEVIRKTKCISHQKDFFSGFGRMWRGSSGS
jgi:hypothetical protein